MATMQPASTPWHLWAVGLVSLLWNCFGGYDYVMTETGNLGYFEMMGMGQAELDFYAGLPAWAVAVWAVGVWGSVAGSILLLMRSRHAETAYLLSLIGALVSFGYQYTLPKPASLDSGFPVIMSVVILILIVAQWNYARRQAAAGVLR
jgi:hypothetical protein